MSGALTVIVGDVFVTFANIQSAFAVPSPTVICEEPPTGFPAASALCIRKRSLLSPACNLKGIFDSVLGSLTLIWNFVIEGFD